MPVTTPRSARAKLGGLSRRRDPDEDQIAAARAELAVANANADVIRIPDIVDAAIARGASPAEAVRAAVKILTAYAADAGTTP